MEKETLTVETDIDGIVTYRNADGNFHNAHGPAIIGKDDYKEHWIKGQRHNPDGPAVIRADGCKWYYINGKLHNENGPAVVYSDGSKRYYINGEELTKAKFKSWQAEQSAPLHNKIATIDGIEYTLTAK